MFTKTNQKKLNNEIKKEQNYLDSTIKKIEKNIDKFQKKYKETLISNEVPGPKFYKDQINKNQKARKNLYFSKIKLNIKGESTPFYIGKNAVEYNLDNIIYDWRSIVGDIYYSGTLGEKFTLDDIECEYIFNRKIMIENDQVKSIHDEGTPSGSEPLVEDSSFIAEYLKNQLEKASSIDGMQDIISTIQKEQNFIIRNDFKDINIIQGVAGSGKTTIAFHRISYLLYKYNNDLAPEDILILAPNKLYLSHIDNVLDPLNIENITQHTLNSLSRELILDLKKHNIKIKNPYENLKLIIDEAEEAVGTIGKFKGSMGYKTIIDEYLNQLNRKFIESIKEFRISSLKGTNYEFSKKEIQKHLNGLSYLPLEQRLTELFRNIERWKNERIKDIEKELEEDFDYILKNWVSELPELSDDRKQFFEIALKIRNSKRKKLKKEIEKDWEKYKGHWGNLSTLKVYKDILSEGFLKKSELNVDNSIIEMLIEDSNSLDYVDVPALLYIEYKLRGFKEKYKHIVIDEGQDLSPFHYYVLSLISSSMTVLGDVTQGVFTHTGIDNWNELEEKALKKEKIKYSVLNISYRSTKEIIDIGNRIIKNSQLPYETAIPVQRLNKMTSVEEIKDEQDLFMKINNHIKNYQEKDFKRIALIQKDSERTLNLYKAMLDTEYKNDVQIITEPNQEIKKPICIIPAYLVKGLEFDGVIIPNGSSSHYQHNELDAKLLYVAVTRALHGLSIFYYEELSPLLKSEKDYNRNKNLGLL